MIHLHLFLNIRVFNLSLTQQCFPTLGKQAAVTPVLKMATVPLLAISDQYPNSVIFSKLFEFVIYDDFSHYLKIKIRSYQRGSSKSKSLVTYVEFICFDVSSAICIVPRPLLPHELSGFGLSGDYVHRFRSYLSNEICQVPLSGMSS
jgi:hypothetical protein